MRIKHQFKIRDASLDRQPKIQSSLVRETLQRILEQTNNDCRFQIFILIKMPPIRGKPHGHRYGKAPEQQRRLFGPEHELTQAKPELG